MKNVHSPVLIELQCTGSGERCEVGVGEDPSAAELRPMP